MLIANNQITELSQFCYLSDKEVRSDLINGFITSENDYTSNFTSALRRNINTYSSTGLEATSFMLSPKEERATGTDAAIIISNGNTIKVILIEGKWPRLQTPNHYWDSKQTASGLSHFSNQLDRQKIYAKKYAIVEMFYDEHPFFSKYPMQREVSACIWHQDAMTHDQQRNSYPNVWSQQDLISMLTNQGTLSISDVVTEVCLCRAGVQLNVQLPKSDQMRRNLGDLHLPANVLVITAKEHD